MKFKEYISREEYKHRNHFLSCNSANSVHIARCYCAEQHAFIAGEDEGYITRLGQEVINDKFKQEKEDNKVIPQIGSLWQFTSLWQFHNSIPFKVLHIACPSFYPENQYVIYKSISTGNTHNVFIKPLNEWYSNMTFISSKEPS